MLRVTPSQNADAARQYFGKSMVRSDYYSEGQEIAGLWGGIGAQRLGLTGQVDQESYFALCDNLDPRTGEKLTPRQKDNRRAGYDFTFSAPKSVSVMYELTGDDRILSAFRTSVKETMDEMEAEMKTRVRRKGEDQDRVTGNMVWAEFVHFTARPVDGIPDPHLHAHVFAHNVTYDETEGRWKAGQFGDLKRDAPYYEAAFDARFAHRLNAMGYETERDGISFELAGFPKTVIHKNSRRRNEIEEKAAKRGITSSEGKHAIGYYGRENKVKGKSRPELRVEWNSWLTHEERAQIAGLIGGKPGGGGQVITAKQAMDYAAEHVFERASVTSEKRLKAEALRYGVGSVLPEAVDKAAQGPDMIRRELSGEKLITTRSVRQEELQMLNFVREGRGKCAPFVKKAEQVGTLDGEQLNAARHVLQSYDRVTGIRGAAGTGKTTMMKQTIAEMQKHGAEVHVFAPSAQASRGVLKEDGFENATTVEELLSSEALQERTKGKVLWVDEAGLLSSKDTRRLFQLAESNGNRLVLSGDYRQHSAVARGDAFRILQSEAGLSVAELTTIRRQKKSEYRQAVESIAKGTAKGVAKGFEQLDKMGAIVEASGEERRQMLVDDYMNATGDGETALVIAPTHAEGDRLTGDIRETLKASGRLGGHECVFLSRRNVHMTTAQRGDARNYRKGQVVQFHKAVAGKRKKKDGVRGTEGGYARGEAALVLSQQMGHVIVLRQDGSQASLPLDHADHFNVYDTRHLSVAEGERIRITANGYGKKEGRARPKRLNNGDIYTVKGFTKDGEIELDNGAVLPKNFGHIAHGYVDTSHAAQGKTVKRVFISEGSESLKAANRAQWYVSVSRGELGVRIYTDDKEALKGAVQKNPERMSVSEMMRGNPLAGDPLAEKAEKKQRKRLDMRRIARYFKERMEDAYEAIASRGLWQRRIEQERSMHYDR
jgi:conjugative relaxase-like TrwC/TraI family protein